MRDALICGDLMPAVATGVVHCVAQRRRVVEGAWDLRVARLMTVLPEAVFIILTVNSSYNSCCASR